MDEVICTPNSTLNPEGDVPGPPVKADQGRPQWLEGLQSSGLKSPEWESHIPVGATLKVAASRSASSRVLRSGPMGAELWIACQA